MDPLILQLLIAVIGQIVGPVLAQIFQWLHDRETVNHALELAQPHVENMAKSKTLSDPQKKQLAMEALTADFEREGRVAKESLIDWAVQTAVLALKAKQAEQTARATLAP